SEKTPLFTEPMEDQNPFQDPAVTQHSSSSSTGYATLDLYNPFDNNTTGPPPPYDATTPSAPPMAAQTPPSRTTPTEPRNYGSYNSQTAVNATTAELLRKQEELEKKAQALERRERELESHSLGPGASRQNNWPPLPSFCPVGPCFYQDISVEISQQFQRTVTIMYYFWIFSACTMFFNLISSFAVFCVDTTGSGVGLGLAILWAILFTPCSFVCWYRPVYKAFRSDSSFNFFVFFFIFFAQVVVYVIMTIGIPGWGYSGWIVSLAAMKTSVPVGAIMMINAILFTALAAMGVVILKKVHSLYRQTDASFQKAQAEFTTGVMSNQAVRQATANVAASAAQGAFSTPR
uniref:Secretory carrier-associated membrane protein n=1 Tax=Mola mola TaxID=94237 RepID=A0A3Q3XE05_MOLML